MSIFFLLSLFFLSYLPLWICIFFKDFMSIFQSRPYIATEIISMICILICIILSYIVVYRSLHKKTLEDSSSVTLVVAKEEKMLSAEYICTFILPLLVFDFTIWQDVVLFLIFWGALGCLCVRHNYYSMNVSLEFMGYHLYRCCFMNNRAKVIEKFIISKQRLNVIVGDDIHILALNNDCSLHIFNKPAKDK